MKTTKSKFKQYDGLQRSKTLWLEQSRAFNFSKRICSRLAVIDCWKKEMTTFLPPNFLIMEFEGKYYLLMTVEDPRGRLSIASKFRILLNILDEDPR